MRKNNGFGFTLIELLVVITIIGILAVGGVSVYTQQMAKARDSTRIRDIKMLQTAIESSFSDNNKYYASSGSSAASNFTGAIRSYAGSQGIPEDLKSGNSCYNTGDACNYMYDSDTISSNNGNLSYVLSTTFEVANALTDNTKDYGTVATRYEIIGGKGGTAPSMTGSTSDTTCKIRTSTTYLIISGC